MTPGEMLVVSGEPLWPSTHGGRIRTARLAGEIGRRLPIRVVAPVEGEPEIDAPVTPLPPPLPLSRLRLVVDARPRLGQVLLDHRRREVLARAVRDHRPRAVLFAQSYLAAMVPGLGVSTVIDLHDLEVRRMASLAGHGTARGRAAHAVELLKARRWEPAVARRAALCSTPSDVDATVLSSWGSAVVLVPHGSDAAPLGASPSRGPVTYVASFGYGPNLHAARWVLHELWPRLREAEPSLGLRLVGRDADRYLSTRARDGRVEVVSDPSDVDTFYREASVVLAPVRAGGGAQVKVTEALARGRVVVATPFSTASAPGPARVGVVEADRPHEFAAAVLRLWRDREERHRLEGSLRERRTVPTWEDACAPLLAALEGMLSRT